MKLSLIQVLGINRAITRNQAIALLGQERKVGVSLTEVLKEMGVSDSDIAIAKAKVQASLPEPVLTSKMWAEIQSNEKLFRGLPGWVRDTFSVPYEAILELLDDTTVLRNQRRLVVELLKSRREETFEPLFHQEVTFIPACPIQTNHVRTWRDLLGRNWPILYWWGRFKPFHRFVLYNEANVFFMEVYLPSCEVLFWDSDGTVCGEV